MEPVRGLPAVRPGLHCGGGLCHLRPAGLCALCGDAGLPGCVHRSHVGDTSALLQLPEQVHRGNEHQDGADVDKRRHFQDRLLPRDPGAGAVLDLRPPPSIRGLRHFIPGLLLQPLPAEACLPHRLPHQQCQSSVKGAFSHVYGPSKHTGAVDTWNYPRKPKHQDGCPYMKTQKSHTETTPTHKYSNLEGHMLLKLFQFIYIPLDCLLMFRNAHATICNTLDLPVHVVGIMHIHEYIVYFNVHA